MYFEYVWFPLTPAEEEGEADAASEPRTEAVAASGSADANDPVPKPSGPTTPVPTASPAQPDLSVNMTPELRRAIRVLIYSTTGSEQPFAQARNVVDGLLCPPPWALPDLHARIFSRDAVVAAAARVPPAMRVAIVGIPLNVVLLTGAYDARLRVAMRRLAHLFGVSWRVVAAREGFVASVDVDALAAAEAARADEAAAAAIPARRRVTAKRAAFVGALAVVGGAALLLTGGLAAPAIAPAFAALSTVATTTVAAVGTAGAAVFAGTAIAGLFLGLVGVATHATALAALLSPMLASANLTAIFGIGGAGLAGYKGARRTGGVRDFELCSTAMLATLPPLVQQAADTGSVALRALARPAAAGQGGPEGTSAVAALPGVSELLAVVSSDEFKGGIGAETMMGIVVPSFTRGMAQSNLLSRRAKVFHRVCCVGVQSRLPASVSLRLCGVYLESGIWDYFPPVSFASPNSSVFLSRNAKHLPTGTSGVVGYAIQDRSGAAASTSDEKRAAHPASSAQGRKSTAKGDYGVPVLWICFSLSFLGKMTMTAAIMTPRELRPFQLVGDGSVEWPAARAAWNYLVDKTSASTHTVRPAAPSALPGVAPGIFPRPPAVAQSSQAAAWSLAATVIVEPQCCVVLDDVSGLATSTDIAGAEFPLQETDRRFKDLHSSLETNNPRSVVLALKNELDGAGSYSGTAEVVSWSITAGVASPATPVPWCVRPGHCALLAVTAGRLSPITGRLMLRVAPVTSDVVGAACDNDRKATSGSVRLDLEIGLSRLNNVTASATIKNSNANASAEDSGSSATTPTSTRSGGTEGADGIPNEWSDAASGIAVGCAIDAATNCAVFTLRRAVPLEKAVPRSMRVVIGVTGHSRVVDVRYGAEDQQVAAWKTVFETHSLFAGAEPLVCKWEMARQRAFGELIGANAEDEVESAIRRKALKAGKSQIKAQVTAGALFASLRAFEGLMATVSLPLWAVWCADAIDNTCGVLDNRAEDGGRQLAAALLTPARGHRPVTLVGYGHGASLIVHCLLALEAARAHGVVEDAILLGCTLASDRGTWVRARGIVAGRLINVYNRNDWLLLLLLRANGNLRPVAGLTRVAVGGVENIDASAIVDSSVSYSRHLAEVLDLIPPEPTAETMTLGNCAAPGVVVALGDHERTTEKIVKALAAGSVAICLANRARSVELVLHDALLLSGVWDFAPPLRIPPRRAAVFGVSYPARHDDNMEPSESAEPFASTRRSGARGDGDGSGEDVEMLSMDEFLSNAGDRRGVGESGEGWSTAVAEGNGGSGSDAGRKRYIGVLLYRAVPVARPGMVAVESAAPHETIANGEGEANEGNATAPAVGEEFASVVAVYFACFDDGLETPRCAVHVDRVAARHLAVRNFAPNEATVLNMIASAEGASVGRDPTEPAHASIDAAPVASILEWTEMPIENQTAGVTAEPTRCVSPRAASASAPQTPTAAGGATTRRVALRPFGSSPQPWVLHVTLRGLTVAAASSSTARSPNVAAGAEAVDEELDDDDDADDGGVGGDAATTSSGTFAAATSAVPGEAAFAIAAVTPLEGVADEMERAAALSAPLRRTIAAGSTPLACVGPGEGANASGGDGAQTTTTTTTTTTTEGTATTVGAVAAAVAPLCLAHVVIMNCSSETLLYCEDSADDAVRRDAATHGLCARWSTFPPRMLPPHTAAVTAVVVHRLAVPSTHGDAAAAEGSGSPMAQGTPLLQFRFRSEANDLSAESESGQPAAASDTVMHLWLLRNAPTKPAASGNTGKSSSGFSVAGGISRITANPIPSTIKTVGGVPFLTFVMT